ncbi:pimeloyl-ACP methyl ester esterase BioH [Pleionea sediminis]|uniref:pimeloyl-ACP methyl ester esterase BioH n=1 Tax=Pleionea sediminis TaxID=2569479 RepID=UPI0011851E5F|nr:pimeloyl-ACP methyl ester esterase BioH [Pleionea sediminis]
MALKPFFEQVGAGPDLVLIHGWGIHGGIFENLCESLAPHFRVTNIDLPGFGRSPLPSEDYTIDLLARQVLDVAPDNAHYLGWSMGGLIASYIAAHHSGRVNKLITVASNPRFINDSDWPHAMQEKVLDNFVSLLEEDYESTLIRFLAIQTLGSETQKKDIQSLRNTVFLHGHPAKAALRGGLNILKEVDLREVLRNVEHDTLRIYGRLDGLVPVKAAERIAELLPESKEVIFRKASHAPFLSHREEFTEEVLSFLKK